MQEGDEVSPSAAAPTLFLDRDGIDCPSPQSGPKHARHSGSSRVHTRAPLSSPLLTSRPVPSPPVPTHKTCCPQRPAAADVPFCCFRTCGILVLKFEPPVFRCLALCKQPRKEGVRRRSFRKREIEMMYYSSEMLDSINVTMQIESLVRRGGTRNASEAWLSSLLLRRPSASVRAAAPHDTKGILVSVSACRRYQWAAYYPDSPLRKPMAPTLSIQWAVRRLKNTQNPPGYFLLISGPPR